MGLGPRAEAVTPPRPAEVDPGGQWVFSSPSRESGAAVLPCFLSDLLGVQVGVCLLLSKKLKFRHTLL